MNRIESFVAKYSPDQPRDDLGRWTEWHESQRAKRERASRPPVDVETRVREAVTALQGSPQRDGVRLSALRSALPDVPKADLDRTLTSMFEGARANLMGLSNPTEIEREAPHAIRYKGQDLQVLWLKGARKMTDEYSIADNEFTPILKSARQLSSVVDELHDQLEKSGGGPTAKMVDMRGQLGQIIEGLARLEKHSAAGPIPFHNTQPAERAALSNDELLHLVATNPASVVGDPALSNQLRSILEKVL